MKGEEMDFGPWVVDVETHNGKPIDAAVSVEAGSANEALGKVRDMGYEGRSNPRPVYATPGSMDKAIAKMRSVAAKKRRGRESKVSRQIKPRCPHQRVKGEVSR